MRLAPNANLLSDGIGSEFTLIRLALQEVLQLVGMRQGGHRAFGGGGQRTSGLGLGDHRRPLSFLRQSAEMSQRGQQTGDKGVARPGGIDRGD